jgi:hypothetical protein
MTARKIQLFKEWWRKSLRFSLVLARHRSFLPMGLLKYGGFHPLLEIEIERERERERKRERERERRDMRC